MKIAIVNDVMLAIEAMRRVVVETGDHQLAWIASDGAEAVERCASDTPDLILMDLTMPRMDGVEATRRIMAQTPCAIVVVTSNVTENSSKVFEAMGAGALDAVNTPVLERPGAGAGAQALLAKIETIRKLLGASNSKRSAQDKSTWLAEIQRPEPLVAIGASAGGPAALAKVLGHLPPEFPGAVVIVQHVDVQFAQGLADWLAHQTPLPVRLAQEDDQPKPGTVLLAGKEDHLVFGSPGRLAYTRHPLECSYRPSIDVFFKSVEQFWQGDVIGVILTGMGRDGAEGLLTLRNKGYLTIAQDRSSSAVYGMPKAAAELKAATEILPLDKIAPRLTQVLGGKLASHA